MPRSKSSGNVLDDEPIASVPRFVHEPVAIRGDLGVNDAVQLLELLVLREHEAPEGIAIEAPVRRHDHLAPPSHDLVERRHAGLHHATREHVCVDDGRTPLRQESRYCRLPAGDVSGETDEEHERKTRVGG